MGTYWLVTLKIQISDWQPQGYIQPPPPPFLGYPLGPRASDCVHAGVTVAAGCPNLSTLELGPPPHGTA